MMIKLFILLLTGCSLPPVNMLDNGSRIATCTMTGFRGFPQKVTGSVTMELKNFMTILVKNKDGSERVEITFPKGKCNAE